MTARTHFGSRRARPGRRRACGRRAAAVALALSLMLAPGVRPAHASDVALRGLLDLAASERGPAFDANLLARGDAPFDPFGVRLFADVTVNPRVQVFAQGVLKDKPTPYVDGAYLMFTPRADLDLHVLAGKVPWAVGTWGPRTYSNRNPLIGTPLIYQHHAPLLWYATPTSADAMFRAAGTGQTGVNYYGFAYGRGMAIVDDSYWDVGVTLTGSRWPLEYALGVTAGTPGWGSTSQDENSGKSWLGRIGVAPRPWLRAGASAAIGPYLVDALNPSLPPGTRATDFRQKLLMGDVEVLAGHLELRAEGARNGWETPWLGTLDVKGGYVEAKWQFPVGAFVAGRLDALRFGEITNGIVRRPWDNDLTRAEVGAGYRFTRETLGKVVVQRTREARPAGDRTRSLVGAQLSVAF